MEFIASWNGIRIPEPKKFLLEESGIRDFFLVESGILGFGIQNTAKESGIPLKIGIHDPRSTDKESGIQNLESRIQECLGFPLT